MKLLVTGARGLLGTEMVRAGERRGLTVVGLGHAELDVTDAEDFDAGNGHAYFRRSPWAARDVLLTLGHGLSPGERGLVRLDGSPIWSLAFSPLPAASTIALASLGSTFS